MAFEMRLHELLQLAEMGMKGDTAAKREAEQAAGKLVAAFDPAQHGDLLNDRYRRCYTLSFNPSEQKLIRQLPKNAHLIFDTTAMFFINHGGYLLLRPEDRWVRPIPEGFRTDGQLSERCGTVLFNQPNDDLTSIVIGRVPRFEMDLKPPVGWSAIDLSVYIYVEAGKNRMPGVITYVDGVKRFSSAMPILYFARFLPQASPILTKKGFHEEIIISMPKAYSY